MVPTSCVLYPVEYEPGEQMERCLVNFQLLPDNVLLNCFVYSLCSFQLNNCSVTAVLVI